MSDALPIGEPRVPAPQRLELKARFVADLVPNERVTTAFLVKHKEVRLKKTGEPFLSLLLGDRTGDLDAKMWDNVEQVQDTFERDDFVKVRGALLMFRNRPQFQVHRLRRLNEAEINFADFLPTSARDVEAMYQELRGMVAEVSLAPLRALLELLLDDPELAARFKRAPAAKSLHHAYFGGLLEHVCSLARLNRLVAQNYPQLNSELVLAGIVLHDMGKVFELSYDRTFAYTTQGQLLGHMVLVLELLHDKLRQVPDFPPRLRVALEHLIISHHGQYEFGSPKLPMFPEALLLHYLDDLDSKMQSMSSLLARESRLEGEWTGYNASLDRPLLKLDRWLRGEAPAAEAAPDGEAEPLASAAAAGETAPAEAVELVVPSEPRDGAVASSGGTLRDMAERLRSALRGGHS